MKAIIPFAFAALLLSACKPEPVVEVTETRRLTTKDGNLKLDATSDERFRNAKPEPFKGELPKGWLKLPPTQFRLMNYRFGESGLGEAYISISGGSVLDNANRWFGQFGEDSITADQLAGLPSVNMLGTEAKVIEAEGTYASGMGRPPKPGYGLYGAMAQIGGKLYTVKVLAPIDEMKAVKGDTKKWIESLHVVE